MREVAEDASRIYLSAPDVGELEAKYVNEAILSGWVAPVGPDLDAFENEMAERVGVRHGVGLSSGTAALHLGLLTLGIGAGDVVITSTMTFAATANAIHYTGAEPMFVDSRREDGNIDPSLVWDAVMWLRRRGRRIGALLPVDLLGKCADMDALVAVAAELNVPLLVDAAESVGASHRGRPAGSFGVASAVSFNGNKVITSSGGGMLLTDDAGIVERVRYLATQARQPVPHYEHTDIGYNYRLSNVLAALGRAQLSRLDTIMARRRTVRDRYRALFASVDGVRIFGGDDDAEDNCWLTSIVIDDSFAGWTAAELARQLAAENIEARPLWKPMHLQPVFAGAEAMLNGNAEWLFEHGLTLPSGSGMSDGDLDRIAEVIKTFLEQR